MSRSSHATPSSPATRAITARASSHRWQPGLPSRRTRAPPMPSAMRPAYGLAAAGSTGAAGPLRTAARSGRRDLRVLTRLGLLSLLRGLWLLGLLRGRLDRLGEGARADRQF